MPDTWAYLGFRHSGSMTRPSSSVSCALAAFERPEDLVANLGRLNRIRNRRNRQRLDQAHQSTLRGRVDSGSATEYLVAVRELIERLPERLAEVAIYTTWMS